MDSEITYLPKETPIRDELLWWQKQGLQETSTGYGSRLTTTKLAQYK